MIVKKLILFYREPFSYTMECAVCCEKVKLFSCECKFECCRQCIRTYLSEQIQEPHCMNCKKGWEPEFLEEVIGKSYTSTIFKKNRAEVYLEHEKTQLAHTQSLVAKYKRDEEIQQKIQVLTQEIKELAHGTTGCIQCIGWRYNSHWCKACASPNKNTHNFKMIHSNHLMATALLCMGCKKHLLNEDHMCTKCKVSHCITCHTIHDGECPVFDCICIEYACDRCKTQQNRERIRDYQLQLDETVEIKEKHEFIMNCQVGGCKGYLSTKYKCGLCEKTTCSTCLTIKEHGHECKEDDVSTVRLIRKETKPCPKCSARISKIDGCDQMWCVECKTAFSWKSGNIVNGTIHNPHYYEYLRKEKGFVPRADNPCGEIPGLTELRMLLRSIRIVHLNNTLFQFHRFLEELRWRVRRVNHYDAELVKNRIFYLLDRIDQKKFTQKAFMYYQRSLRFQHISGLLQMLSQVLLDQLSLMMDVLRKSKSWRELQEIFRQVQQVMLYFYEQKRKSPYTSIREEHIKITIEYKGETFRMEEFDMDSWMDKPEEIRFMISG